MSYAKRIANKHFLLIGQFIRKNDPLIQLFNHLKHRIYDN